MCRITSTNARLPLLRSLPVLYLSPYLSHSIMSEIRRKLVIVGDGACGKVTLGMFPTISLSNLSFFSDLSLDCLFEGHVPRGYYVLVRLDSASF